MGFHFLQVKLKLSECAGWDIVGVDLDLKAVESARKQGLDVCLGGVETLDPSNEQFDVVILAHVIG